MGGAGQQPAGMTGADHRCQMMQGLGQVDTIGTDGGGKGFIAADQQLQPVAVRLPAQVPGEIAPLAMVVIAQNDGSACGQCGQQRCRVALPAAVGDEEEVGQHLPFGRFMQLPVPQLSFPMGAESF